MRKDELGRVGYFSRVQDSGFRIQCSEFRVQGSGFRVQDSGSKVQGQGCSVTFLYSAPSGTRTTEGPSGEDT